MKELLCSFHLNGHILGFHSQTQKLGKYCSVACERQTFFLAHRR